MISYHPFSLLKLNLFQTTLSTSRSTGDRTRNPYAWTPRNEAQDRQNCDLRQEIFETRQRRQRRRSENDSIWDLSFIGQKISTAFDSLYSFTSTIVLVMIILTCIHLYLQYMFPELVFIRKIRIALYSYIEDFSKFIDCNDLLPIRIKIY